MTPDYHNQFVEYLSRHASQFLDRDECEKRVSAAERVLSEFLRENVDANFPGLYAVGDALFDNAEFYENIRRQIFSNPTWKQWNDASEQVLDKSLKYYAGFLRSRVYRGKEEVTTAPGEWETRVSLPTPALDEAALKEGALKQVTLTTHERNPELRAACIRHFGCVCQVCGMDFEEVYGEIGRGYIEVHHLFPVAGTEGEHLLNPIKELVTLCSNCHSMIHRGGTDWLHPLPLEKMQQIYRERQCQREK